MTSICDEPAWKLALCIRNGELSPLDLMRETLDRIERRNPGLNAFVALRSAEALAEARKVAERLAAGEDVGPLAGIPFGVKDLEDTVGMVTSYGSIPFRDNLADGDSIQVARLKAAGAIVVGKTNVPEFGFTGFTKNRLYGVSRNPWNRDRTPGGSSGGSAAAVAAGLVPFCTGSDAGGSIRIPASYSGCVGFKPTFGRIPIGPAPIVGTSNLTVAGPLTRCVRDAALYLDVAAGVHPADPSSLPNPGMAYLETIDGLPEGLAVAFSPDLGYARVAADVLHGVEDAVSVFATMGHRVDRWQDCLTDMGEVWPRLIAMDICAQLDGLTKAQWGQIGRTLAGVVAETRSMTVADITAMQRSRAQLNDQLAVVFERYDLLLTPTMPTAAFSAGGPPPAEIDGHPIPLLGAVAFTYPFNLSGHPAISVPAGLTRDRMPVGLQIIAPRHRDDLVLQAARAFEQARPWNGCRPAMHSGEA